MNEYIHSLITIIAIVLKDTLVQKLLCLNNESWLEKFGSARLSRQ